MVEFFLPVQYVLVQQKNRAERHLMTNTLFEAYIWIGEVQGVDMLLALQQQQWMESMVSVQSRV